MVLELEARYFRLLDAWAYEAKMAGSSSGKVPNLGLDSQDFDINPDQITGLDTSLQQLLDLQSSDEEDNDNVIEVSIILQITDEMNDYVEEKMKASAPDENKYMYIF
ncbi:hypothetical protein ElyMa_004769800 [Elysia marginata]|uniref:Uncharacterized protein n=1 Tax=Elysia marginata TaxID=1093978 RepID=A0AAV4II96_9GAST|nr:hypothetical protein ElyMa_004769800 [Elysia marginata]